MSHQSVTQINYIFSGKIVKECGFFMRNDIGASPDGVGDDFLLEIKTRGFGLNEPLAAISKSHYVQANVQMYCTNNQKTVLMSYHPETKSARYFIINYDNSFMSILLDIIQSIKTKIPLNSRWESSSPAFDHLHRLCFGQIPDFSTLKPLRSWIGKAIKNTKQIQLNGNW